MNPGLMETICLKIKDGANIVHLDEYVIVGTHWIALYALNMIFLTLTVLELNTFLKRLKHLLKIKT